MTSLLDKILKIESQLLDQLKKSEKKESLANKKDFGMSDKNLTEVPEYIKIGNIVKGDKKYDALFPLIDGKGFTFDLSNRDRKTKEHIYHTMESIAIQLYERMDSKYVKIIALDNLLDFTHIKPLIHEKFKDVSLFGEYLERLLDSFSEVFDEYDNIKEYNSKSGEIIPYHFVFISNVSLLYDDDNTFPIIQKFIEYVDIYGVFFFVANIMADDDDKSLTKKNTMVDVLGKSMVHICYDGGQRLVVKNCHDDFYNKLFNLVLDTVDIDIRNVKQRVRDLSEMLDSQKKNDQKNSIRIPIGKAEGKVHYFSLGPENKNYSAIILGQQGTGKTNLIYLLVLKGITTYDSSELQFFLMDAGGVGFSAFKDSKGHPISDSIIDIMQGSNVDEVLNNIEAIEALYNERVGLFNEKNVENIIQYNQQFEDKLPYVIILIDEAHNLVMGKDKDGNTMAGSEQDYCQTVLSTNIARQGRKLGLYLVFATQSLDRDFKENYLKHIPLRMSFVLEPGDATDFFQFDNEVAAKLEQHHLLYNTRNGIKDYNIVVKVDKFPVDMDKCKGVEEIREEIQKIIKKN